MYIPCPSRDMIKTLRLTIIEPGTHFASHTLSGFIMLACPIILFPDIQLLSPLLAPGVHMNILAVTDKHPTVICDRERRIQPDLDTNQRPLYQK